MPTIVRLGPYRLFFYSNDRNEAPHVHVERDENMAKFWLEPVRLESTRGFGRAEVRRLQKIVVYRREILLRCWNEYFQR